MGEDLDLTQEIEKRWGNAGSNPKARRYIGKFWDRTRRGSLISGMVQGNHGNYHVSIELYSAGISSRCSCYIGKHGYCHHCAALGLTFLAEPESFAVVADVVVEADQIVTDVVRDLDTLQNYLNGMALADLLKKMRQKGITQKAFCAAVGMSTGHLSTLRSSELRNRRFHELGATKLAVLWVMENLERTDKSNG